MQPTSTTKNKYLVMFSDAVLKQLYKLMPDKYYIMFEYYLYRKRLPNLKDPVTFSEKIQWLKLYGNLKRYAKLADKLSVRPHVEKTIGAKYLVPLLGVYDKFDDIDFDKLPKQFILKVTIGSGYNYVCKDKSKINKKELKKYFDEWVKNNYFINHRESQYKPTTPKIIAEEFLNKDGAEIEDYKFFCSKGVPSLVETYSDIYSSDPREDLFDMNWKRKDVKLHFAHSDIPMKKPEEFEEMVALSKKLSKGFPFVRVDLYVFKGIVYFGELTFTPGNGMYIDEPESADLEIGKLIDLSMYK